MRCLKLVTVLIPILVFGQEAIPLQPIAQIPSSEVLDSERGMLITTSRSVDMDDYDTLYTVEISSPYQPRILKKSLPLISMYAPWGSEYRWHADAVLFDDIVVVGVNQIGHEGDVEPGRYTTYGPFDLICESLDGRQHTTSRLQELVSEDSIVYRHDYPTNMCKINHLLFYDMGEWGLRVFDMTDPLHPSALEPLQYNCSGIQAEGNLLLIEGDSVLTAFDYTDEMFPNEIWRIGFSTEQFPYNEPLLFNGRIFFRSDYVRFPDAPDLAVIDALNVAGPIELGRFELNLPNHPVELAASAGRFYTRDGSMVSVYTLEAGFTPRLWKEVSLAEGRFTFAVVGRLLILSPSERSCPGPTLANLYDIEENEVEETPTLPVSIFLSSFPNPFNSSTTISYTLPRAGHYSLTVTDITGREVARLSEGWKSAGSYREVWDGGNVGSGSYYLSITDNTGASQKISMILLK